MATLNQALIAKLASSGLTPAHGKLMQVKALTKVECETLRTKCKAEWPAAEGLLLPYFHIDGRRNDGWRLRYFEPPGAIGFSAATNRRPLRYVQAPNAPPKVYIPPLIDWAVYLANPAQPLIITEGELKAAAGCARGLYCVGVGGVYNFQAPKRGVGLLPEFADLALPGRHVYVVYDSDIVDKPDVALAQVRIGYELLQAGAFVHFGTLPHGPDGEKQGLDDYLRHHTVAQFKEQVLDPAVGMDESESLHRMNSEVFFVAEPSIVVEEVSGLEMSVHNFKNANYANRHFKRYTPSDVPGKKPKIEVKPTADAWLKWEHRREYSAYAFEPGQPLVIGTKRNTWKGWGVEPKKGDVKPWYQLLEYMFKEAGPKALKYFLQWCAWPMQNPSAPKMFICVVMYSQTQGVGKSIIGEILGEIYGKHATQMEESELHLPFNAWCKNMQFILSEEATSSEFKPAHVANILKNLITRKNVRINEKHVKQYDITDRAVYYFATNHPDAFVLADSDRRTFVNEIHGNGMGAEWFEKVFVPWKEHGGIAHLFYHLLHEVDCSDFHPRAPAMDTPAKRRMAANSLTDVGTWLRTVKVNNFAELYKLHPGYNFDLWSVNKLYMACFPPSGSTPRMTKKTFIREVLDAGIPFACQGEQVHIPDEIPAHPRAFALRNPDMWRFATKSQGDGHFKGREVKPRTATKGKRK